MIKGGGVSINKEKIDDPERIIGNSDVLNNKYILAQAGKKVFPHNDNLNPEIFT